METQNPNQTYGILEVVCDGKYIYNNIKLYFSPDESVDETICGLKDVLQ